MKHIMMDIETFGTGSNAVVISISAVQFDLATGEVGREFEGGLDPQEQIDAGAKVDMDTIFWWLSQSKGAQTELTALVRNPVDSVLYKFSKWLRYLEIDLSECELWGNGATFDNVLVRNLYKRHKENFLIPFWCDRDVRTLVSLGNIDTRAYKFNGTRHNGLDDCKHQIKYCVDAHKKMKGN